MTHKFLALLFLASAAGPAPDAFELSAGNAMGRHPKGSVTAPFYSNYLPKYAFLAGAKSLAQFEPPDADINMSRGYLLDGSPLNVALAIARELGVKLRPDQSTHDPLGLRVQAIKDPRGFRILVFPGEVANERLGAKFSLTGKSIVNVERTLPRYEDSAHSSGGFPPTEADRKLWPAAPTRADAPADLVRLRDGLLEDDHIFLSARDLECDLNFYNASHDRMAPFQVTAGLEIRGDWGEPLIKVIRPAAGNPSEAPALDPGHRFATKMVLKDVSSIVHPYCRVRWGWTAEEGAASCSWERAEDLELW